MSKVEAEPASQELIDLLTLQQAYKAEANKYQAKEREIRDQITAMLTPNGSPGRYDRSLANNYRLRLEINENISVDPDKVASTIEAAVAQGLSREYAVVLIRWKPELSMTVYNKLDTKQKLLLAPMLTSKPASPTIEIKEMKR